MFTHVWNFKTSIQQHQQILQENASVTLKAPLLSWAGDVKRKWIWWKDQRPFFCHFGTATFSQRVVQGTGDWTGLIISIMNLEKTRELSKPKCCAKNDCWDMFLTLLILCHKHLLWSASFAVCFTVTWNACCLIEALVIFKIFHLKIPSASLPRFKCSF